MKREPIRLSVEKRGSGIRFKRQYRHKLWVSRKYRVDSDATRLDAWQFFQVWKAEHDAALKVKPKQQHKLLRQFLAEKIQILMELAEHIGECDDSTFWRNLNRDIPTLGPTELLAVATIIYGTENEHDFRAMIEASRNKR